MAASAGLFKSESCHSLCVIQKPRCKGYGGGLAVIHIADILVKQLPVLNVASFECAAFSLAGHTQLQVVLIYRPPKASSTFLSELSEVLTSICSMSASTLLLGDFNIHVDSTSCPFISELMSLLDCFNITQHVKGPTPVKGDLVCSTGAAPSHQQCLDLAVFDHYAIIFTVPVPVPKQRVSHNNNITYRYIKTVNTLALTKILETHLASDPLDTSLDGLVVNYNAAISWGLDFPATLEPGPGLSPIPILPPVHH